MKGIPYRIGLDIGTNSIGWCVFRLDENDQPQTILRTGVRIFSEGRRPKDLASLAADRRQARQMRRRHDRVLKRQTWFIRHLIQFGLMPEDDGERLALSALDPYLLRKKGLYEPLTTYELGRALYHLAKRRGFQSSRKTKGTEAENETGKVNTAVARLQRVLKEDECQTVGEWFAKRRERGEPVRVRQNADGEYPFYPQRALVAEEFDLLWHKQAPYHPRQCTDEAYRELRYTLLLQRPLKPVEPGRCRFEPDQPRIPVCSPLFQRYRILADLNHLRIRYDGEDRILTVEQRNILAEALHAYIAEKNAPMSFKQMQQHLKLPRGTTFNFEKDPKRKGFKADANAPIAIALGKRWTQLSNLQQEAIAVLIEAAADDEQLDGALAALPTDLTPTRKIIRSTDNPSRIQPWLEALARLPFEFDAQTRQALLKVSLPDDYGSLSRKALERIIPVLEAEVITYDKAVKKAGYDDHADFYDGVIHTKLPYYGKILGAYVSPHPRRHEVQTVPDDEKPEQMHLVEKYYGRIANPTVHIGLTQLRLLVNAMIRRWGAPRQIVVELAREFGMSGAKRNELKADQKKNQDNNERIDAELLRLGQRINRDNRERYKLWEELGGDDPLCRTCVYSGQRLCLAPNPNARCIFSAEVEIDHILPFSRTLDDSLSNKLLCVVEANRSKADDDPHGAFSGGRGGYDWDAILERAKALPARKQKRFKSGAVDEFLGERSFLDRHLNDTAYLSRVARQYLIAVCPRDQVLVSSGRLTGMLRGLWGLPKDREDHRHHAVDAAVVGVCDRRIIQTMANAAKAAESIGQYRKFKEFPEPWPGFREQLLALREKIVISHKPDRGAQGALHDGTNYGMRALPTKPGQAPLVAHRIAIESVELKNVEDIPGKKGRPAQKVADPVLRERLYKLLIGKSTAESNKALVDFSKKTKIRRVTVHERLSVEPIKNRYGEKKPYRYVATAGNHCLLIYRSSAGTWKAEVVTTFKANQPGFDLIRQTGPNGEPVLLRLHKEDMVLLETSDGPAVLRVVKMSDKSVFLADHRDANASAKKRYKEYSAQQLHDAAARTIGIDVLGYLNDPGFKP
jgi:CRISPR-associated endonuclease Csn1